MNSFVPHTFVVLSGQIRPTLRRSFWELIIAARNLSLEQKAAALSTSLSCFCRLPAHRKLPPLSARGSDAQDEGRQANNWSDLLDGDTVRVGSCQKVLCSWQDNTLGEFVSPILLTQEAISLCGRSLMVWTQTACFIASSTGGAASCCARRTNGTDQGYCIFTDAAFTQWCVICPSVPQARLLAGPVCRWSL